MYNRYKIIHIYKVKDKNKLHVCKSFDNYEDMINEFLVFRDSFGKASNKRTIFIPAVNTNKTIDSFKENFANANKDVFAMLID